MNTRAHALQSYTHTIYASYVGYITQAIVNNLSPLLFLTFSRQFGLSLDKITLITTVNFAVQLAVDLLSAHFVDRIGYRVCIVAAHVFSAAGLVGLALLPWLIPGAYGGILISVVLYAIGGGLIEVMISPIVEACPTEKKDAAMSLLHSFYCWGHLAVILLSTLFSAWRGWTGGRSFPCSGPLSRYATPSTSPGCPSIPSPATTAPCPSPPSSAKRCSGSSWW